MRVTDAEGKLLAEMSTQSVGWGSVLADFDLDGQDDLAVANGNTLEDSSGNMRLKQQVPFVFWNAGDRYLDVASVAGPATSSAYSARGLAAADFDNDGDVDLALSINRGRPLLLRNDTKTENHSVKIRLDGHPAICFGARVELTVGDRKQVRWWGSDASFLSMHALELIFGIGTADRVDQIRVRWADGTETVLDNRPHGLVQVKYTAALP
jgi:hypothetical protein